MLQYAGLYEWCFVGIALRGFNYYLTFLFLRMHPWMYLMLGISILKAFRHQFPVSPTLACLLPCVPIF